MNYALFFLGMLGCIVASFGNEWFGMGQQAADNMTDTGLFLCVIALFSLHCRRR